MPDAKLQLIIEAKNETAQAFNELKGQLKGAGDEVGKLVSTFKGMAAALGVGLSLRSIVNDLRNIMEEAVQIGNAARRIDMTTEALSGLTYAAEQSGVSVESLVMSIQLMLRSSAQATVATSEEAKAFRQLGVDVEKFLALRPEQKFMVMAQAFSEIGNQGEKIDLAIKIFGRGGGEILQLLAKGETGIAKLVARARELGMVMGADLSKNAKEATQAIDDLGKAWRGLLIELAASKPMQWVIDALQYWTEKLGKSEELKNIDRQLESVAAHLKDIAKLRAEAAPLQPLVESQIDREEAIILAEKSALEARRAAIVRERMSQGTLLTGGVGLGAGIPGDVRTAKETAAATSEARTELERYIVSLRQAVELLKLDTSAREVREAVMRAENILAKEHLALSGPEYQTIRNLITGRQELIIQEKRSLMERKAAEEAYARLDYDEKGRIEIIKEEAQQIKALRDSLSELKDENERFAEVGQKVYKLYQEGKVTFQEYLDKLTLLSKALPNLATVTTDSTDTIAEGIMAMSSGWAAAMADMEITGKMTFAALAESFLRDFLRKINQALITDKFFNAVAPYISGFIRGLVPGIGASPVAPIGGIPGEPGAIASVLLGRITGEGAVTGGPTIQIYDQRGAGQPVSVTKDQTPSGQLIKVWIRDEVNQGLAQGYFDKSFSSNFGVVRKGVGR